MPRITVKYDSSGDHCVSTADDVADAICCVLESNFYTTTENKPQVKLKIVSIDNQVIKYSAKIYREILKASGMEPRMSIMGTARARTHIYKEDDVVKLNSYLVVDWELA